METEKIQEILTLHRKWLNGEESGEKANLREADLREADLHGADLQGANLQGANLREADLQGANLQGANLRGANLWEANLRDANLHGADLREADLHGADLQGANLQGADLQGADLQGANLREADLQGANLQGANLREADLREADLQGANLREADLREADLQGANLPDFLIVPSEGSFVAWKKCKEETLVKLLITEMAKRHSCITSRKCRASEARVLQIMNSKGDIVETASGTYNSCFVYRTGGLAIPDSYDPDIRIECSNGIHFFITREEAEQYCS